MGENRWKTDVESTNPNKKNKITRASIETTEMHKNGDDRVVQLQCQGKFSEML